MGQKVHPKIFRLNVNPASTWLSRWFGGRALPAQLREDVTVRDYLYKTLKEASVDRVEIERSANAITIIIATAKPGFIIGRAGSGAEELKEKIRKQFFKGKKINLDVNVIEVSKPSLSSRIVMQQAIADLEKRMPFRRVLKQTIDRVEKAGARGIKITVAGRLNGAEIARSETLTAGKLPLHNLRADIDYAQSFAQTIYGSIGVKVWIYRGDVFSKK